MAALAFWVPSMATCILAANAILATTAVLALGLLAARFLRHDPLSRYWTLCGALVLAMLAPVGAVLLANARLGLVSLPSARSTSDVAAMPNSIDAPLTPDPSPRGGERGEFAHIPEAAKATPDRPAVSLPQAAAFLSDSATSKSAPDSFSRSTGNMVCRAALIGFVVWIVGVAAMLARVAYGYLSLRRIVRHAAANSSDVVNRLVKQLAVSLKIAHVPTVLISNELSGPIVVGIRRPKLILPEMLCHQLSESELRDVLIHELAHVARRDLLILAVQNFAADLSWPHPLIHLLNRALARAREEICDNYVLAVSDPADFGQTLLHIAEMIQPRTAPAMSVAMFNSRWHLETRIAGLLNEARHRDTRLTWPRMIFAAGVIGALAVPTIVASVALAQPVAENPNATAKAVAPPNSGHQSIPTIQHPLPTHDLPKSPNNTIVVAHPVECEVNDVAEYEGMFDASRNVKIIPRVTGCLVKTFCAEGAIVKTGDELFLIDPRPYQAAYDQAAAETSLDQSALALAAADLARKTDANKKVPGAVTPADLDHARAANEMAHATLAAAKAHLMARQQELEQCDVRSPIGGRLGQFKFSDGNLVTQDQSVLTTVVSDGPIHVSFEIDERTYLRIRRAAIAGLIKRPEAGDLPISVGLLDEDGYPHRGIVTYIADQISPGTGTATVQGVLTGSTSGNSQRLVAPGMSVHIQLQVSPPHKGVCVGNGKPWIQHIGGKQIIWTFDGHDTFQPRPVKFGAQFNHPLKDGFEVVSGLTTNDLILAAPRNDWPKGHWVGDSYSYKCNSPPTVKVVSMTDPP